MSARKDGRPRSLPAPLALDPMPWSVGDPRDGRALRSATEETGPVEWCDFDPRPGYSQNREDYA